MRADRVLLAGGLAALGVAALGGCAVTMPAEWGPAKSMPSLSGRPAVLVEMAEDDRKAFEEGVALVAELKYAEAQERFARVAEWYQATGDDVRASETLFWQGFCYEKTAQAGAARRMYRFLLARYPSTAAARLAVRRLSRLPADLPPSPTPRPDVVGTKEGQE